MKIYGNELRRNKSETCCFDEKKKNDEKIYIEKWWKDGFIYELE